MKIKQQLQHIRALMGIIRASRPFGGPVQATMNLTNRCNIRCIHCYAYSKEVVTPNLRQVKKARRSGSELPDRNAIKRLQHLDADTSWLCGCLEQLLEMGTRRYQISGSGEPFLHKDILTFISLVKRYGSYCVAFTNGTCLEPNLIDDLIRLELDELRITTMAGSKEMYNHTHPGIPAGTFEKLKQNLKYFHERKASVGTKKPRIVLIFVIIRPNVQEIVEFSRFAADVGVESVQFHPINYFGDDRLTALGLEKGQIALAQEQLLEARAYLEQNHVSHNIDNFHKIFAGHWDASRLYQIIQCYIGYLNLSIDLDRCVYPCFCGKVPFGNTSDQSLREIWYGRQYQKFRSEAGKINRNGGQIDGCDCKFCVNYAANLDVYRKLHPFRNVSLR